MSPIETLAADTPLYIVINASSGKQDGDDSIEIIRGVYEDAGRKHKVLPVDAPGKLSEVARRAVRCAVETGGAVVAAGGDGTINGVAATLLERDTPAGAVPLGVVPLGTFNYFARAQELPLDVADAARATLGLQVRPAQVGLVNGRPFLVNASLGLYPELMRRREQYKQQYGRRRSIALLAALRALVEHDKRLRIDVELGGSTRTLSTSTVIVENNRLQLEQIGLPEAELVENGRLAAIIVRPLSRLALLGLAVRSALGRLASSDDVEHLSFRRLTIAPARTRRAGMSIAIDGEILRLEPPLRFEVASRRLRLIAPP